MACNPEILRDIPLFALLDDDEMAVLAGQVELRTFAARQRIYKMGDPGGQFPYGLQFLGLPKLRFLRVQYGFQLFPYRDILERSIDDSAFFLPGAVNQAEG